MPRATTVGSRSTFTSVRVEISIGRFFDECDSWPYSHSAIRRRLEWATGEADELEDGLLYPHALRETAASAFAARGLDILSLQAMMG
ncbi:hypothetical protein [Natrialba sp. INN-245]|uniref:hypothetical protein n=1 Tax=Natrialba sp. INN-245 TaxID=2690967 RepID=UPI001312213A|nr:hypothetical protein [Natrialba sp. INN-245]MWV40565.1 hypothetical protein [Natrialba sp. INN-245]